MTCQAVSSTSLNQDYQEKNNNLRNSDDTTIMAENKEELKSLLIKVKEESEKSVTVSIVSSSICHEDMGPNAMIFV